MNKEEFLEMIFETIQLKNRYKGMFMWVQNGWANTRRSEEKWACGSRIFVFDGHVYKYELDYSISCKHYYLHINCCTKDGGGDVRAWKKLIKEIDPDFYKKKVWLIDICGIKLPKNFSVKKNERKASQIVTHW